jgi:hypothetical protein
MGMGVGSAVTELLRKNYRDPIDGQPLLTEEALVHDKSDHTTKYNRINIIHFYIAARDTVVNCEVSYEIWRDLAMKSRGTLTHQGGKFYSFETQGVMYIGGGEHVRN